MQEAKGIRRWVGMVFIVGLGVFLAGDSALAKPPPPSFYGFTVSNSTGDQEVRNLKIQFYAADEAQGWGSIKANPVMVIEISALPSGMSLKLEGEDKLYAIARINATAKCPASQSASVEIEALHKPEYDPTHAGDEYAGFCPKNPGGADCPPRLEIYKDDGQYMMRLIGCSRWGGDYSAPIKDEQPFN